jgi:hypothetical protein
LKTLTGKPTPPSPTLIDWGIAAVFITTFGMIFLKSPLHYLWNRLSNWENFRKRKTLKKQAASYNMEFLKHFPEDQHPIATAIRKSLAKKLQISPQYIHHDTPLTSFSDSIPQVLMTDPEKKERLLLRAQQAATIPNLKKAAIAASAHCHYLSPFSFSQKHTAAWWEHYFKQLIAEDGTVQSLVHAIAHIERRLGEVLKGLDLGSPPEGDRLEADGAGG